MTETTARNGASDRESAGDRRQGEPGHPVRYVLVTFTMLGGAGLILIYLLSDGVFGP